MFLKGPAGYQNMYLHCRLQCCHFLRSFEGLLTQTRAGESAGWQTYEIKQRI